MKTTVSFTVLMAGLIVLGAAFAAEKAAHKAAVTPLKEMIKAETPVKRSGKGTLQKFLGEEPSATQKMDVQEPMKAVTQKKEPAPRKPVLASHLIPPLTPTYRFVTPFSGLPSGWVDIANISYDRTNVIVKVYDRDGELREAQAVHMPPHGYASSRDMFGGRHIPEIADPAVVEVISLKPVCVTNCRYRSSSQAWGFDVWPTQKLEEITDIPIRGFTNAKIEFANPWAKPVRVVVFIDTEDRRRVGEMSVEIPPKGYASTADAGALAPNLYDLGSPLTGHIQTYDDGKVAINLARWSGNRGWGVAPAHGYKYTATFPFGGPASGAPWPRGCLEADMCRWDSRLDMTVIARVYNRDGGLVSGASAPVERPGSHIYAYVRTNDFLGDHIPAISDPAAAFLGLALTDHMDLKLRSFCAAKFSDASGCAFPVLADELITEHAGEVDYEFPANGFANASVELTNVGDTDAVVRLIIYDAEGETVSSWLATLLPKGYLSTADAAWRSTLSAEPRAVNIYEEAKPCVIYVAAMGGKLKVAHTRWSDWGAAGFSPLPKFMMEEAELPRIEVIGPADDVGFVELGGEEE